MMRKIGIMGGSFDPPHLGHEYIIARAVDAFELHEIIIVPAHLSPFKSDHGASPCHRLEMTVHMCDSLRRRHKRKNFSVWRGEIDCKGPSYSWKTVDELYRQNPAAAFFLIIGKDNLYGFYRWKRWKSILELASLLVIPRGSGEGCAIPPPLAEYADTVHFIDCDTVDISSTEVRDLLSKRLSPESLLNGTIYEYIRDHSLYSL